MTFESPTQQPQSEVFRDKAEYKIIKAEIKEFAQIALMFPQNNKPEFIKLYFLDRLVDQGVTDEMLIYFFDNHFDLELAKNFYSLRENISLRSENTNPPHSAEAILLAFLYQIVKDEEEIDTWNDFPKITKVLADIAEIQHIIHEQRMGTRMAMENLQF